jgi:hypothetical protein
MASVESSNEVSMTDLLSGRDKLTAIAAAQTNYANAAFKANKAYFERLATLNQPHEAMQLTTDHMRAGYETFVAESKKIGEMYKDFFVTAFTPKHI